MLCQSWDMNLGISDSLAGCLAAAGFLDLHPGRREALGLVPRSLSVLLSLPALTSVPPGAHISVLFIVFLPLKPGPLLSLLKLHVFCEPSFGPSEEVITYLNCGLDVDKGVGTQWDKGDSQWEGTRPARLARAVGAP